MITDKPVNPNTFDLWLDRESCSLKAWTNQNWITVQSVQPDAVDRLVDSWPENLTNGFQFAMDDRFMV